MDIKFQFLEICWISVEFNKISMGFEYLVEYFRYVCDNESVMLILQRIHTNSMNENCFNDFSLKQFSFMEFVCIR